MSEEFMQIDGAFDFDSEFTADTTKPEFPVLQKGTYRFMVESVERTSVSDKKKKDGTVSQYAGCPMAAVSFRVTGKDEDGEEQEVTIKENFMLHKKFIWKISQLFISVGLAKNGEKFKPNWMALPTLTGMCEVDIREFNKNDGTKGQSNYIKEYLESTGPATPAWSQGW